MEYTTYQWNAPAAQMTPRNSVIDFQGELYCYYQEKIYQYDKLGDWNVLPLEGLPEALIISEGGIYIDVPADEEDIAPEDSSDRWHVWCDTEVSPANSEIYLYPYVGTPVEPINDSCICPMQTLMAHGCKCGGG